MHVKIFELYFRVFLVHLTILSGVRAQIQSERRGSLQTGRPSGMHKRRRWRVISPEPNLKPPALIRLDGDH